MRLGVYLVLVWEIDSGKVLRLRQDCSGTCPHNQSFSSFSVGSIPCYVGIVSDFLSCIASVAMVVIYITWVDVRQNTAQSIVTFIAIADFFTPVSFFFLV